MLLLLACTAPQSPADPVGTDTAPEEVPLGLEGLDALGVRNVVLIHVDTLRSDHLPLYGYARDTLPNIGGKPWMVVSDYYTTDTWTLPSTTTAFTGLETVSHGFTHVTADGTANVSPVAPTLAGAYQEGGYVTFLGMGNSAALNYPFLADGFDVVGSLEAVDSGIDGLTTLAVDWLDTLDADQPFFMVLQPMDVHGPYRPGDFLGTWTNLEDVPFDLEAEEDEQSADLQAAYIAASEEEQVRMLAAVHDLYDECILKLDAGLSRLLDRLDERGLLDTTLVVLTSDHGETIGENEHGVNFGHGSSTRPELTRVPLAFYNPRLPDQDLSCLSQNMDLAPTLTRLGGVPDLEGIDGAPLQDGCRDLVRASTFMNNTMDNQPSDLGVSDGHAMVRWSCRWNASWYYDLDADPGALDPRSPAELPTLDVLESAMTEFHAEVQTRLGAGVCDAL